jgi:8-oxo-dGDP phosphatase
VVERDYVRHIGSVAVVPVDAEGQVVLVRQYRHPVGGELWELPAGLRDVAGEDLAAAATRELAEETDLVAERWDVLLDLHTSPGCSDERIRIFLARELAPAARPHVREHEEATMAVARFALDDAVWMALTGQITNAPCVAGVLAAARVRDAGWTPLRPVDAAEPQSPPAGLQ